MSLNGSLPYVTTGVILTAIIGAYRFSVTYMNGRMVVWENNLKEKVGRRELESVERRMEDGFKGVNQRLTDMSRHLDLIVTFIKKNGNHT